MLKYIDFISEKKHTPVEVDEDKLDTFIYSKEFGDVINIIKINPIANDIILCYDNLSTRYTYIDVTEDDDLISYMDSSLAKTLDDEEDIWNHNGRKKMKVGKFVNKNFPDRYDAMDIEKFVNQYKSVMRSNKTYFKIFKGKNMIKWYSEHNVVDNGMLGQSCMRYDRCLEYLDLYTNNPEKISLLVLFEKGKEKAIGRSLLWKIDSHDTILMDRIYTSHDSDINIFRRYARENNIDMIKDNNGGIGLSNMYTKLKPVKYESYPFLDTLFLYQPETGIISDTIRSFDLSEDVYILDDTYGSGRLYKI